MIRHTYTRPIGGPPYSSTQRAAARRLAKLGSGSTVTPAALEAMTSEDGIEVVADVLFELESNRLGFPATTRLLVNGAAVSPASGTIASLTDGKRVGTPVVFPGVTPAQLSTKAAVVEIVFASPRRVNVVEVHGAAATGQITGASIETRNASGTWTPAGSASSAGGRLSVWIPDGTIYGVRARLDTIDAGSSSVAVVEVDPMLILDISDDVESVEVSWSRESDPGSSSSPIGNYEASEVSIEIDDTGGLWNPATNAALDLGHRIEVAFGVVRPDGLGGFVEELFPAGVFYSEPFDTDSAATTVSISGVDRLGRNSEATVSETVRIGSTIRAAVTALAAEYLDLDSDQVKIDQSLGDIVFPYLYPSGNLGTYLADIAKALAATIHVDALERLVLARRNDTSDDVIATITDETSLLGFRRPPGYDVTSSSVTVTAAPLTLAAVEDLWAMPSGGITIPTSESRLVIAQYENVPAVYAYVFGIVADGSYTLTGATYFSDRAELMIRNNQADRPLIVADLRVRGNPLEAGSLTARAEHEPSIRRYGPRDLPVEATLAQTQTQVDTIADVLLDAFRSIDDDGIRRLPDLGLDALGLLHIEAGDRVTLSFPAKGLGGDYTILGRTLTYSDGAILSNDVRVRESAGLASFLSLDGGLLLDDGHLVGY